MYPSTYSEYKYRPYKTEPTFGGVNWAEYLIERGTLTHEDIPTFSFAPLDKIRQDLIEAGYSQEEVENTIAGLSELPEYANSK